MRTVGLVLAEHNVLEEELDEVINEVTEEELDEVKIIEPVKKSSKRNQKE